LGKRCGRLITNWAPRNCKLMNHKLKYYKHENCKVAKGVINFDLLTCAIEVEAPVTFRILILKSSKIFYFRASDPASLKEWVYAIHRQILLSEGARHPLTSVSLQPNFWKYDRMSQEALMQTANTGDLILFRSYGFMAKVQRLFTCSYTG